MLSARLGAVACAPGRAGPVLRLGPSPRLSAALDGFAGITVTHPINRGRASLVPAAVGGSGSGAAPAGNATPGLADAFDRLRGITVHRVSDKQEVEITSLWGADERAVLAFGRHMGWLFCWELARQLHREVAPALDAAHVQLYLVTIGTAEKGDEFAAGTGFPASRLLADPSNACYEALNFRRGLWATMFGAGTPAALKEREASGRDGDLKAVLKSYKMLAPPSVGQVLWQGGVLVFEGPTLLWAHADPSTAVHADLEEVVAVATQSLRPEA